MSQSAERSPFVCCTSLFGVLCPPLEMTTSSSSGQFPSFSQTDAESDSCLLFTSYRGNPEIDKLSKHHESSSCSGPDTNPPSYFPFSVLVKLDWWLHLISGSETACFFGAKFMKLLQTLSEYQKIESIPNKSNVVEKRSS